MRVIESVPSFGWWPLSALGLLAALALLYSHPARAAGEVKVDGGGAIVESEDAGGGMPSSNPRVGTIVAAHPDQYVVVCVAGCDGKPRVVQLLPRPATARIGGYVPSMAKMGRELYGPPSPSKLARRANSDVVCVAGCIGRTGQVLQRVSGLPPLRTVKPSPQKRREEKRNEPLDIDP